MTTFSEQFPIVFQALNIGFLQTLKLFFVTLIGAIPLGLIISFGSMSSWAPLGFLRPLLKNLPKNTKLTWWQRFQIWCYVDFKPIRIIVRFIIWVVRGTPLMLQLLVFYYFPGLVMGKNIWGGGEAGRFLASSIAFIFNYACYFSEIFRGGIQGVPQGQREAGQVARGRKETDFMPVQAASVFILRKRGNGNSGFRPFPGLRQQIECRDGTVRNHYILLFHLIAAGKQSFQGRSIRFRITREFIKLLVQVFPECAEIGSMPYI